MLGSPGRIIRIVLHGLRGSIVVLGREHTGDMPAFKALEDDQIAAEDRNYKRPFSEIRAFSGCPDSCPDTVRFLLKVWFS